MKINEAIETLQNELDNSSEDSIVAACSLAITALRALDRGISNEKERQMNYIEREEIADQIAGGITSGMLDSEGYRCAWELRANIFKN